MEDEEDIVAVSEVAEDLRDVLLEYWVSANPARQWSRLVAETMMSG